jgi:RimJ/RimL family protein N-acetyltransferase
MNWPTTPTLIGRHVTLRPIDRADRDGLLAVFADGFEYSFSSMVPGTATIDAWFDTVERDMAVDRARVFAVIDAAGQISGTTRFMRMNYGHRRIELGGTLYAARVRRTGLNTEAKRLLLGYAFEVLNVLCVQIRTDFLNLASRRAIERLGARQDGILRNHMVIRTPEGGQRQRDTVVYSILAHEWPGVQRHLDGLLAR